MMKMGTQRKSKNNNNKWVPKKKKLKCSRKFSKELKRKEKANNHNEGI